MYFYQTYFISYIDKKYHKNIFSLIQSFPKKF